MPSLTTYRRSVAPRLGPYAQGTATSGSTTAVLEATAWPFKTTLAVDDLYSDQFIFRPAAAAADRTRLVAASGYAPSLGRLSPDLAWASAPYQAGPPIVAETFELHGLVPPVSDGINDLHGLINEALKTILLVVEITGTPVEQATRHSLGTIASWLQEPSWVYQVGLLAAGEDRNEVDPFRRVVRGTAEIDGDTVYLNHPGRSFATTETLYVRLLKPAYYHCRASGGSFGGQSGLTLETDEAVPETEWVTAATLVQAWLRLATVLAPGDSGRAQAELAKAAAQATRFQRNYLESHRPRRTLRPLGHWGPVC